MERWPIILLHYQTPSPSSPQASVGGRPRPRPPSGDRGSEAQEDPRKRFSNSFAGASIIVGRSKF